MKHEFSDRLRFCRRQRGLTQEQLAEAMGVSVAAVSKWELGRSYPDLDMLLRLCDALHATPDQLLYPPERQTGFRPAGIVSAGLFQKIAAAVFVLGFVLGVSAGNEAYAPAPDTVGWHFVFRYAPLVGRRLPQRDGLPGALADPFPALPRPGDRPRRGTLTKAPAKKKPRQWPVFVKQCSPNNTK